MHVQRNGMPGMKKEIIIILDFVMDILEQKRMVILFLKSFSIKVPMLFIIYMKIHILEAMGIHYPDMKEITVRVQQLVCRGAMDRRPFI